MLEPRSAPFRTIAVLTGFLCASAQADENLFGYLKGAEPLPAGAHGKNTLNLEQKQMLHNESEKWRATLTWFPQIRAGGETYPGQTNNHLHPVEKTKHETRLKFGVNFQGS